MCLAIFAPAGKKIPATHVMRSWKLNPDGGGYCYRDEKGKVVIKKAFPCPKIMLRSYLEDFRNHNDSSFAMHLRKASKGGKGLDMTHPFPLGDNGALLHNGTISRLGGTKVSDSKELAELISKIPEIKDNKTLIFLAELYTAPSRVILYLDDTTVILNRGSGVEENGIWYSNDTYKRQPKTKVVER